MAHPNEENLRKGYEAFGRADIDAVMALFADDIQWHVPGRNPVSGDYSGKEEVGAFFTNSWSYPGGLFGWMFTTSWQTMSTPWGWSN